MTYSFRYALFLVFSLAKRLQKLSLTTLRKWNITLFIYLQRGRKKTPCTHKKKNISKNGSKKSGTCYWRVWKIKDVNKIYLSKEVSRNRRKAICWFHAIVKLNLRKLMSYLVFIIASQSYLNVQLKTYNCVSQKSYKINFNHLIILIKQCEFSVSSEGFFLLKDASQNLADDDNLMDCLYGAKCFHYSTNFRSFFFLTASLL